METSFDVFELYFKQKSQISQKRFNSFMILCEIVEFPGKKKSSAKQVSRNLMEAHNINETMPSLNTHLVERIQETDTFHHLKQTWAK
jgi:hypothetical protein